MAARYEGLLCIAVIGVHRPHPVCGLGVVGVAEEEDLARELLPDLPRQGTPTRTRLHNCLTCF
ncbi:hypothetical protein [Actinomadura sp. OS1-43]|uniref:hypothetical protein n=1 Tax=Actinomadura sp. OS1-43 TaxID=604315 RepID=UPI00255AC1C3|nr:hypothetical protein [Actinomadura sp. OS1-43]MDL4820004.1 hypothetical protein [Actinomadura sp. OS1-43]